MDILIERYIQAAWGPAAESMILRKEKKIIKEPSEITAKILPSKSVNRPSDPSNSSGVLD